MTPYERGHRQGFAVVVRTVRVVLSPVWLGLRVWDYMKVRLSLWRCIRDAKKKFPLPAGVSEKTYREMITHAGKIQRRAEHLEAWVAALHTLDPKVYETLREVSQWRAEHLRKCMEAKGHTLPS